MAWMRLGTRGSPLALAQARMAAAALAAANGREADEIAIEVVKTTGDLVQDRPLAEIGGKALWTKELDAALLAGRIDFAVHSLKDVETELIPGVTIAAILPREDARDCLFGAGRVSELPEGARVGTSSPRRAAQARALRPDLRVVPFRGNVDTRLKKLADGEAEATLLAAAGLIRLGREAGVPQPFSDFLPAPSQAAVGITARSGDGVVLDAVAAIDDRATRGAVMAERALLSALGATCHTCVAAHAAPDGHEYAMEAELLAEDGSERVRKAARFAAGDGAAAASELARALLADASPALRRAFGTR